MKSSLHPRFSFLVFLYIHILRPLTTTVPTFKIKGVDTEDTQNTPTLKKLRWEFVLKNENEKV